MCHTLQRQVAAAEESRQAAAAELAGMRRRTAEISADGAAATEQAALWEGRAAGLQARVIF